MGMTKAYGAKLKQICYCHVIVRLHTKKQFMALTQCLHIINPLLYIKDKTSVEFDKIHQTRFLTNTIRSTCKRKWKVREFATIDEKVVRCKGSYFSARQNRLNNPIKWRLKYGL